VIGSKYANPEIGRRNLETLVAATLEATLLQPTKPATQEFLDTAALLSHSSMASYRALVYETPGFTEYFFGSTPIREIAELNIGSRPASRKATQMIEDLRAIPWGFSWGQCRLTLPGWYGFGSAVHDFLQAPDAKGRKERLALLQKMHRQWQFFGTLLSNMDMVMAKSDLALGARYAELVTNPRLRKKILSAIESEWHRTADALAQITGHKQRLANNAALQRSIRHRFPYIDPLHHLQVELIRRYRAGHADEHDRPHSPRQDAGDGDGGAHGPPHQAGAMRLDPARGQVGRDGEEGQGQIRQVDVAVSLLQQTGDLAGAGHGDDRHGEVRERVVLDEGAPNLEIQPFEGPAQGRAGGDDRAHGGAAREVDGDPGLFQGPDRADVAIGPRASAGQDHPDRRAGDDAGDPLGVLGQSLDAMEPAIGL
jgi:hypothetical protein